jgi:hypothetical protein
VAIRRKRLQGFQQRRASREGSRDHEWPGPSGAEHRCKNEITDEVVELPTESRADLPLRRAKGGKYDQG